MMIPRKFLAAAITLAVFWFASMPAGAQYYRSHAEIGQILLDAQNDYPGICQRHNLGYSVQGRELWALSITDNIDLEEDEPEFKYISTMHGNEIVGNEMCLYLIDHLLSNYGTDPDITNLVDEIEIWIVPLMNPDGYESTPRTRNNAHGVNLNRDFPDPYTSPDNSPEGREPETAAIMNWSFGRSFTLAANYHGGALVVNYPFDANATGASVYTATPDDDLFIWSSEEYSQHNPPMWGSPVFYHGITNGADWYVIYGGMQDWSYVYMGCNEVTIEVSNIKQPSASQLPDFWDDNRESMLAYMQTSLIGIRGLVTDTVTGEPVLATITVDGRDHEIYTDPDVGDYHRMLLAGTYDLTFEADGYDPGAGTDVVVSSGDATLLDVQLYPAPQILSPNGGEILIAGTPTTVTWTGNPAAQFQVQYTDNYGNIGIVTDGFERSILGSTYETGGDAKWYISFDDPHAGLGSARAGSIGDDQRTWLERTFQGTAVSFWYRVSSEAGYDFFDFSVDGDVKVHASGTGSDWTLFTDSLPPGSHVLEWEYHKDGSTSEGSDTAWIDDLEITTDDTTWTDITPLTDPGEMSTAWTPLNPGEDYRVRVRSYTGGIYGPWDESDASFTVVSATTDGDYDDDGDVDLGDVAWFQICFGAAATGDCGDAFEFIADGVIDLEDFAEFMDLMFGPQESAH